MMRKCLFLNGLVQLHMMFKHSTMSPVPDYICGVAECVPVRCLSLSGYVYTAFSGHGHLHGDSQGMPPSNWQQNR